MLVCTGRHRLPVSTGDSIEGACPSTAAARWRVAGGGKPADKGQSPLLRRPGVGENGADSAMEPEPAQPGEGAEADGGSNQHCFPRDSYVRSSKLARTTLKPAPGTLTLRRDSMPRLKTSTESFRRPSPNADGEWIARDCDQQPVLQARNNDSLASLQRAQRIGCYFVRGHPERSRNERAVEAGELGTVVELRVSEPRT